MSEITSLDVEFLFHMHATLADPVIIPNGPAGTRVVVGITGGSVKGPKVNGTVAHLGAALITTDDGSSIHAHYLGIMSPGADGSPRIVTAPLFEAGDERYTWLNGLQAVAVGAPGAGSVDYDVYRIL
jgi:hypothetical protein